MENTKPPIISPLTNIIESKKLRYVVLILLGIFGLITIATVNATDAPNIPAINLSSNPLYATSTGDKPVIALALSVEFPTVGAQYLDTNYANTNEYLGYYDAESCYTYNDSPSETPDTGLVLADYKRFDRTGAATNRTCTNAFSGNFLNWSSSSAIDMLRIALSGGDRYIDTSSLTILQRAVLPNGSPRCFWNSNNFPSKQLPKGSDNNYMGAIPTTMKTQANGSDVYVANTLNQIYFGTSVMGSCGDTSGYTLGGPNPVRQIGPIQQLRNTNRPSDTSASCASEGNTCQFSGIKEVWYGANQSWAVAPALNGVACTNGVFTDPLSGTSKSCYTRPYTGTWRPTGGTINSDGFYYARVQVCNKDSTGALLDVRDYINGSGLCTKYPNGNYKPTGAIQKYSDQLRLAAFGYLMDQESTRVGGVLRAPMKYVGSKIFDINGNDVTPSTGNPNAEWDNTTGVFASNPDNDITQSTRISGVVNYLNKFGRTGSVAGRYKIYDPVGELHYETLRYLQGLQPTPAAISNITADMYDGFPASKDWTDPYGDNRSNTADYSCQKSNIVVIGDVNSNDKSNIPTPDASKNIPDITGWLNTVRNFENNIVTNYIDGQGITRATGNPNAANSGTPYYQIIGSSYWAHTHDIRGTSWTNDVNKQRPGLRARSFLFDVNENGSSNNSDYRRYRNQFFMAAKYGGFESTSANSKPYNTFGNPFKEQDETPNNKVWEKASSPNEAGTYYLQSSAREVLKAFEDIFNRATTRSNNIAGNAVSSKIVTSTGSLVYQGSFDTSDWTGDVLAYPASAASSTITIGTTPTWTAATRLTAMTSPVASRNIIIGNSGASSNPVASEFLWNDSLSSTIKASLGKFTPSSTADSNGEDRLKYLRGDKTKEGSLFRIRSKLLGDIINSGIVYSGAPTTGIFYSSTYSSFYNTYKNRTAAVFVGSNDGMLHSFNASTGDELFAYIPSWMTPKLAALTSTAYNTNHQSYVDSTPDIAEAQIGSAGTAADWKTVLVSGTGAGGSGVFALNVTDPTNFTASQVMWEFSRADDPDMGFVVGKPKIMRLRTSASTATTATYRWFALVASGVNNYVVENSLYSTSGNPSLFLLALDKPTGTNWNLNNNYYKITIPVDSSLSATNPTGLINFRATFGNAGELKEVFMGDLHGKLWKLNFALKGTSDWTMDKLSPYKNSTTNNAIPMYVALNSAGAIQPISMAPSIKAGPLVEGLETNYVIFGTGKYLESSDKATTLQNSVYAIFDNGTSSADRPNAISIIENRNRLIAGAINTSTGFITAPQFTWGRAVSSTDTTQRSGWYVDFATLGEREVSNGDIVGNTFSFASLIPAAAGSTGSCTTADGGGKTYYIDITSGNGTSTTSTSGMLGESIGLTADISLSTTSKTTGRRQTTKTTTNTQSGTKGFGTSTSVTEVITSGRLSWRQINNYQDLVH